MPAATLVGTPDPDGHEYADIVLTETTSSHVLTTRGRGFVDHRADDMELISATHSRVLPMTRHAFEVVWHPDTKGVLYRRTFTARDT